MRITQVNGLPLLDTDLARQAGAVSGAIVDTRESRVVALQVAHGDGYLEMRVPVEYVDRVERNRVLAAGTNDLEFLPPIEPSEGVLTMRELIGLIVIDDSGERVGRIADATIDRDTLELKYYLMQGPIPGSWIGGRRVTPDEVVGCSTDAMLVTFRRAEAKGNTPAVDEVLEGARGVLGNATRTLRRSVARVRATLGASGRKDAGGA